MTETARCEVCGKPIPKIIYWQKYCSNACRQKAKRERKKPA